jgi:hypothetical protein
MPETIHRNFSTVADAEAARAALLDAGFHGSAVQLNLHDTRSASTTEQAVESIMDSLTPDDADDTDRPLAHPAALLSIDVEGETQREHASTIASRYGGAEA